MRAGHTVTMLSPYATADADALYTPVKIPCGTKNRTLQFALNLRKFDFSKFDLIHAGMDDWALLGVNKPFHIRTFHGSCFAEAMVARLLRDKIRMVCLGLTELLGQRSCDVSTAVSADTNRYFPKPNIVIPNGVDLSAFTPSIKSKSKHPSILFIGMLDSRKRGRQLLDVSAGSGQCDRFCSKISVLAGIPMMP